VPAAKSCLASQIQECPLVSESEQQEYELLCPDGTTAELTEYSTCNLGKGPGRGIITRHNFQKITNKFLSVIQVSGYYKLYISRHRFFFHLCVEVTTQFAFFLEKFIVSVNKALRIGCSGEGSCMGSWKEVLLFSKVFFCRRLGINK